MGYALKVELERLQKFAQGFTEALPSTCLQR
uniref:Uncharacterized protein n=1 Tax=Geobacter sp. (strain M21) TaxID=443144 RepID=C6E1C2_GEOSM